MKRFLLILLSVLMLMSLASCGDKTDNNDSQPQKDIDVVSEANSIIEKYSLAGGMLFTSSGEPKLDDDLIRSYYGDATDMPDFSSVSDYAVYIDETKPLKPCEFGIFKMNDNADKEVFIEYLMARVGQKIQTSSAYPSMDTEALTTAKFTIKGNYVWYIVVKGGNEEINSDLEGKL